MLVVNQKAKVIELTAQFKVFDQHGNQIGSAFMQRSYWIGAGKPLRVMGVT